MTDKKQLQAKIKQLQDLMNDNDVPAGTKDAIRPALAKAKEMLASLDEKKEPAKVKSVTAKVKAIVKAVKAAPVKSGKGLTEKSLKDIVAKSKTLAKMYAGTSEKGLKEDAKRKAGKAGSRVSASGKTYREYRGNRTDISTEHAPYLAKGGKINTKKLLANDSGEFFLLKEKNAGNFKVAKLKNGKEVSTLSIPYNFNEQSVYHYCDADEIKEYNANKNIAKGGTVLPGGKKPTFSSKGGMAKGGEIDDDDFEEEEEFTDDEPFGPDYENDAFIDAGGRGGTYNVSFAGKFLGNPVEMDDALALIKAAQKKQNWFPTLWFVSDHGNEWPIDLEGNEIKVAKGGTILPGGKKPTFLKRAKGGNIDGQIYTVISESLYSEPGGQYMSEKEIIDFANTASHYDQQDNDNVETINTLADAKKYLKTMDYVVLKGKHSLPKNQSDPEPFSKGGHLGDDPVWHMVGYNRPPSAFTPAAAGAFKKAITELQTEKDNEAHYKQASKAMTTLVKLVNDVLIQDGLENAADTHKQLQEIGIYNYKTGLLLDTSFLNTELANRKLAKGGELGKGGGLVSYMEKMADQIVAHYLPGTTAHEVDGRNYRKIGDYNLDTDIEGDGSKNVFINVYFGSKYAAADKKLTEQYDSYAKFLDELAGKKYFNSEILTNEEDETVMFKFSNPRSGPRGYKKGGRLKSALKRDRKYKSEQSHEKAYNRKTKPVNPRYNVKAITKRLSKRKKH